MCYSITVKTKETLWKSGFIRFRLPQRGLPLAGSGPQARISPFTLERMQWRFSSCIRQCPVIGVKSVMGYSHKNRVVPRKFMLPSLFCGREFFCFLTSSEQKAYVFQKQKTKFFIIKVCFFVWSPLFPQKRERILFLSDKKSIKRKPQTCRLTACADFDMRFNRLPARIFHEQVRETLRRHRLRDITAEHSRQSHSRITRKASPASDTPCFVPYRGTKTP